MKGLQHIPPGNSLQWFNNFIGTYPTPEHRRKRALDFIPTDGTVTAFETQPTRIALSALWDDPEFNSHPHSSSLREMARYLGDIGVTVKNLAGQQIALIKGIAVSDLAKDRLSEPPQKLSVRVGTMTGEIRWSTQQPPSQSWRSAHGIDEAAPALKMFATVASGERVRELKQSATGETSVSDTAALGIPYYAGQVCLEESPALYRASRDVRCTTNLVFGDYHVEETLQNLERHADDMLLPVSALYRFRGLL